MLLGYSLTPFGHDPDAWTKARDRRRLGFDALLDQVAAAEAAGFDFVLLADRLDVRPVDDLSSVAVPFEPTLLASALATRADGIGIVAAASTVQHEPYNLARRFASLDLVSKGAYLPAEGEAFADRSKLHPVHRHGKHFSVDGILESQRSPQGRPIMVQAGASDVGKDLAARTADVVFAASQTKAEAQAYYADVKSRLGKYGRSHDDLKVMPGISPIVGATEEEAKAKYRALQELIPDAVGVALLASYLSIQDLSAYPLDGPLPDMPPTNLIQSRQQLIVDLGKREGLSIRELARHFAGARGHWQVTGTPAQIADAMEERFMDGAADGFNVMAPLFPSGLEDFVTLVVPELQRRGLFREEYEGRTLRANLGVSPPAKS